MKYWEIGNLKVSENNKYLLNGDTPFFWLADTAWLLMQQCSLEDAFIYLKNRKEKGYNVILTTLVHSLPGENSSSLAKVKRDVHSEEYWAHCDAVVKMAEDLGLYMGLLPTWGSIVKGNFLNMDNVNKYGDFLGNRFKDNPNIVWVLGGDIRGTEGCGLELYPKLAEILRGHTPNNLITFHPFGRTSSSLWFHDQDWLDFNMFQSGHRRYNQASLGAWDDNAHKEEFFGEDNWKYVDRDLGYQKIKPTVDGEPSYEQIPQGLHDPKEPYWQACDARRYAYWSVFQGAMGHTYGNNAIMQFNICNDNGNYGVKDHWKVAMHHEGSSQMRILKELMLSVDYQNGKASDELLISGQKEKYDRVSVFAGKDFIVCYSYEGEEFELDLTKYIGQKLFAYWVDPAIGSYSFIEEVTDLETLKLSPNKKFVGQNDWVLIIKNS